MDSNSDEEVRQQCDTMTVDEAMQPSPVMGDEHFGDDDWIHDCWMTLKAEVRRQREASAVTAVNFGKAQLEIARLQTKLARVEALVALWKRDRVLNPVELEEIASALRDDPQPSAAPTPKGEPYNGY